MRYFFLTILFLGLFVGVQIVLYQNYDSNKSEIDFDNISSSIVKLETTTTRSSKNFGSGIIISQDGYIVTAYHLLRGAYDISANILGDKYNANIVGFDEYSDIAVIKVNATGLKPMQIETKLDLKIGDRVYAIGNPFNVGISVSSGILSATGRNFGNPYLDILQTDASINRGNSGGALIDTRGRLIGINTLIRSSSGGSEGIGLAIPSTNALEIISDLIQYGEVRRGWLGFSIERIHLLRKGLLVISEVVKDGPAYKGGLMKDDVIKSINSESPSYDNLYKTFARSKPNEEILLEVKRGSDILNLSLITGQAD